MIRGAIFDIDGTLLDSMPIWQNVGARYLISKDRVPEDNLAKNIFHMTLEESCVYLKEKYSLSESTEEIKEGVLGIVRSFYINEVKLKDGVRNLLTFLGDRKIPMICATTGNEDLAEAALKREGVFDMFKGILTCTELGTSKREPLIYLKAADTLGTKPDETLVFEDVIHAILTAKSAGFVTVGVEDKESAAVKEDIMREADYYVSKFKQPYDFL